MPVAALMTSFYIIKGNTLLFEQFVDENREERDV